MKYRVTCLTPTLVGDGQKLSPIDYMVWKDQVNVLDQRRIFRLLAKGPRLEGYLAQLRKSDKLDFASWGGFAQNFAGRRIPFEHASMTQFWNRANTLDLFIPTFATGTSGAYLPASALKGALRTGLVYARWNDRAEKELAERGSSSDPRALRRAGPAVEEAALGQSGQNAMRAMLPADSSTVPDASFKVYLLRVSTLESRGGPGRYELAWKTSPRGAVPGRRPDDSTASFAEMATPGTSFEGSWHESAFLKFNRATLLEAANGYSSQVLALHRQYAEWTGLARVHATVAALEQRIADTRRQGNSCVLPLGWGGGLLSKTAHPDTQDEPMRQTLGQAPFYSRAIQSGLPFPKTRRIVFLDNQPATLPGWVQLDIT